MATFIEIQTDAFAKNVGRVKTAGINYQEVRRPYRGIEIKEDTYGIIKVMNEKGDNIPLVDSGGPYSPSHTIRGNKFIDPFNTTGLTETYNYSNFIIQSIQDVRQEKQQVLETFGDSYIFFYGERPRILQVSGLLMNTVDFNWRTEFWYNYEHLLRGTKLVELGARIYLHWDDIVVEGYMLGASARDDANTPYHIPFSFQLFVTNHTYLSAVGDDDYPITHAVDLDSTLRGDIEAAKDELKAQGVEATKYISNVERVRKSLQASEQARQESQEEGLTGFLNSDTGQGLIQSKNMLAAALAVGVRAQNLTFLSVVNHYFRARKMRFPRGIGGQYSYAGPPQYAGEPHPWAFKPERKIPYRSKIRDNTDEYINKPVQAAEIDREAADKAIEDQKSADGYELERKALLDLQKAGIDPVQHPGGSPLKRDHALAALAGVATEAALLNIGFSVARGFSLLGQGQQ